MSFGLVDTTGIVTASKTILVKNYGTNDLTFDIVPTFRYATDAALGAVSPSAPASVTVAAGGTETFDLEVTIDGSLLKTWYGNSGSRGDDPDWLDDLEIDGYLMLDAEGTSNDIHLPWHVLPRKAADIEVVGSDLVNSAVNDGLVEGYNLYAVSDDLPGGDEGAQAPVIDLKYVGGQTFALPDALGDLFCVEDEDDDPALILALAVTTWERQTHANAPALFEFDLDIDQDGVFDYAIYNADLSLASGDFDLSDGRNAVFVENLETGDGSIFFLTDHDTNSGNTVLLACSEQIGLTFADLAAGPIAIDVAALAADIYFTGNVTDSATFTMTPGWERFLPFVGGAPGGGSVPGLGSSSIGIIDFGGAGATELGLLFLYRGGAPEGNEAGIVLID